MSTKHEPKRQEENGAGSVAFGNQLLDRLPRDEADALRPHLERVSLPLHKEIITPDEPIRHVYFPVNMLASLVTMMRDGSAVESGSVGREGMVGVSVLLDAGTTTMLTVVQVPGETYMARAQAVKEFYDRGGEFQKLLRRYMHTVIVVGSRSTACNRLHHAQQRLCRWLLMCADGIGSHEINITQEYLAVMLGVRRAGVSEIASSLQAEGIINYRRGRVRILDRARLEAGACECYVVVKAEYDRLFN